MHFQTRRGAFSLGKEARFLSINLRKSDKTNPRQGVRQMHKKHFKSFYEDPEDSGIEWKDEGRLHSMKG